MDRTSALQGARDCDIDFILDKEEGLAQLLSDFLPKVLVAFAELQMALDKKSFQCK